MSLFGVLTVSVLCAAAAAGGFFWLKKYYADTILPKAAMLMSVAEEIDGLPPCSMDNLAGIRGIVDGCGDKGLSEAFSRYEAETIELLRSRVAPEAEGYFQYRLVYGAPDADGFRRAFRPFAAASSVILALTPLIWALLDAYPGQNAGGPLAVGFGISLLCVIWSAAVWAVIAALDAKSRAISVAALEALVTSLRSALPTAGESTQAALLLDGVSRTGETFAASADLIVRKIDSFAMESVIPAALHAFNESIANNIAPSFASMNATLASLSEAVSAKQEEGIRLLAAEFSEQLFGAVERQIGEVTANIEKVGKALSAASDSFETTAGQIRGGLVEDRETLKSVADLAAKTVETQNHTAESIFTFSDYLAESRVLVDALRVQSGQVMTSIAELTEQSRAADEAHAAQLEENREALTRSLLEVRAVLADNAALLAKYGGNLEQSLTAAAGAVQGAYDKSRVMMMEYMSKADESVRQYIDLSTERLEKRQAADADEYARRMEDGRIEMTGALEAAKLALAESSGAMSLALTEAMEAARRVMAESAAEMSGGMTGALEATRQALNESTGAAGRSVAAAVEAMRLTSAESAGALSREMGSALEAMRLQQAESSALFADYGGRLEQSLAGAEETIRRTLDESRALMAESLAETGGILQQHIDAGGSRMESVAKDLMSAAERQENTMNISLGKLVTSISASLQKAMESNAETASRLARTTESLANAGTEQYEKAAQAAAQLLENIVTEINKAMEGVGEAISGSIGQATADNADIVRRLAEQTSLLKEEYDAYFSRIDETTRNSFDDLDFHMQNVSARFAEETQTVIVTLQESISGAMGLFEGNTATLLTSLDEQSRSIGLYAKELSFDISSLSTNLREAVAEFSEHLHEGVVRTFDDFDEGLSEVSKRLANTVESIRDSVDNLPAAISGQGRGA